MSTAAKRTLVIVWFLTTVVAGYQGVSLYQDLWGSGLALDSAVQEAALAAYRTGVVVTVYVIARGVTTMVEL